MLPHVPLSALTCLPWEFSKFPFDSSQTSTPSVFFPALRRRPGTLLKPFVFCAQVILLPAPITRRTAMVKSGQAASSSPGDTPAAWNRRRKAEDQSQEGNGHATKKPRTRVRYGTCYPFIPPYLMKLATPAGNVIEGNRRCGATVIHQAIDVLIHH